MWFEFYGVGLRVECADAETLDNIRRDFSWFLSGAKEAADITVSVYLERPPYEKVPPLKASLYNPDSISYDDGCLRYVDHEGKGLTIYDYQKEAGSIYADDKALLHELAYLLIHSRVGELLDKKGIHRIHALGVSYKDKGVLSLLPQGAGKTTLALELLKSADVKLLSDDITLLKKDGTLLAFPLRLGVSGDSAKDIPKQYLRVFRRRKYGPKTLIDIDYFKDKISFSVKPYAILIGQRVFSDRAGITRINKLKCAGALIRDSVIGLGLPQMVEYFLRWNFKDIFNKISIVCSRLLICLKVLRCSKAYHFLIGQDKVKNSRLIIAFLKQDVEIEPRYTPEELNAVDKISHL